MGFQVFFWHRTSGKNMLRLGIHNLPGLLDSLPHETHPIALHHGQ